MSVLVVQIPPRRRLGPQAPAEPGAAGDGGAPAVTEWAWSKTDDGLSVHQQGVSAPGQMPNSEAVVAVLSELDVSWHSVTVPRAPGGKLRAALLGTLEEQLLSEPEQLHVALAPEAEAGARAWVAVTDKAWLAGLLNAFERQGVLIDRVVPALWPGEAPHGHFFDAAPAGGDPEPAIAMADTHGIVCLPLAGTLARALLPTSAAEAIRWTAPAAVSAAAERWLGEPVDVRTPAQMAVWSARSTWNLRQFDLAPRLRGSLALRDAWRRLMRPAWRPARLGLVAVLAVQVLALNLWAWSVRQSVDDKRQLQGRLLGEAHPQVRLVRDAPLQMERETDLLRAAAGRPGPNDLESLLSAASAAWPDNQGPMQNMRFQTGQLTLSAAGWGPNELRQFTDRLRAGGWSVTSQGGRVVVARSGTP